MIPLRTILFDSLPPDVNIDLIALASKKKGHLFSGILHEVFRFLAKRVRTGRVSECSLDNAHHGIHDSGIERSCGIMIQVDERRGCFPWLLLLFNHVPLSGEDQTLHLKSLQA